MDSSPQQQTSNQKQVRGFQQKILYAWYNSAWWLWLLWPVSLIFQGLAFLRRRYYQLSATSQISASVIVIGNITIGGTGKTPLVISLTKALKRQGYQPGIISRGYKSQAAHYPYTLNESSTVAEAGDEPLLIYKETACPVVIDPNRLQAAHYLIETHTCDVIISDDGLQHYALPRDIEIIVLDGDRKLGNGLCLPAGPLREPPSRLLEADMVVVNGAHNDLSYLSMGLQPVAFCNLLDARKIPVDQFIEHHFINEVTDQSDKSHVVHGVAAIGNPQRFFQGLRQQGMVVIEHVFPDHHDFSAADLAFNDKLPVVMTSKDAVKCVEFAQSHWWYLQVEAQLDEAIVNKILTKLNKGSEKSS